MPDETGSSVTLRPGAINLKPGDDFDPSLWLWAKVEWIKGREVRIRYREIDTEAVKSLHLRSTT